VTTLLTFDKNRATLKGDTDRSENSNFKVGFGYKMVNMYLVYGISIFI